MAASSKITWFTGRAAACLALLALPFAMAVGCSSDPPAKKDYHTCKLNSDCKGSLVCSFGLCHAQCADTGDCPAPQRCVRVNSEESSDTTGEAGASADATQNICQLPDEATCTLTSMCPEPLVCAADLQCRNQCGDNRDCLPVPTPGKARTAHRTGQVVRGAELG